jgi:hypothetical protein
MPNALANFPPRNDIHMYTIFHAIIRPPIRHMMQYLRLRGHVPCSGSKSAMDLLLAVSDGAASGFCVLLNKTYVGDTLNLV